jgi:general secretion pathway protein D
MKVIEGILKDLDNNPTAEQAVFIYHLENAQSRNLEGVLNALFGSGSVSRSNTSVTAGRQGIGTNVSRTGTGFGGGGSGGTGFGGGGGGTGFGGGGGGTGFGGGGGNTGFGGGGGNTGFGGGNTGTGRTGGGTGFGATGGGTTGRGGGTNSLASDLSGQVFVVADYDTNSLIVMTPQKNFDRVKAVIKDLDRPVPQVEIKVLIAEVTHAKNIDVGTDFSVLTKGAVQAVTTDFGVGSLASGAVAKIVTGDVTAALRAIETEGKLEVLSRPYILASNNQQSNITVGQEVPFIVSSRTTDTGQTINTIQYQDIGIILNVTAHINDDGLVIMDVAPEVSSLTGQTVPIQAGVEAPVFAKRSAQSRVGVPDGKTIVIGGLMEDKKTDTNSGIPVLRNMPYLGRVLFGRRQRDKSKTELLIFLTPHVAQAPCQLKPMADQEIDALRLIPNAIKPGTFDEHMRGMERGSLPVFEPMVETVPPGTPRTEKRDPNVKLLVPPQSEFRPVQPPRPPPEEPRVPDKK